MAGLEQNAGGRINRPESRFKGFTVLEELKRTFKKSPCDQLTIRLPDR
jgi:hypothetical protein